jgi:tRNA threonylcarbamoyladenosine biosynthesis protein TsaE
VNRAAGDLAPVRLRTGSAQDTRALGAALARGLRPGDVVLVAGELGAGKTTLAQGIGAGLGVADHVTSPTFTLVRSYPCPTPPPARHEDERRGDDHGAPPTVRTFLHADLYRLEHLGEVVDLALGELVEDDTVAVVEWGDGAEPVLGAGALSVHLAAGGHEDERCVSVTAGSSWSTRRAELAGLLAQWATP